MDRRPLASGLERAAVIALGLYLLGTGVDHLGHGRWLYTNYLGLAMPAPLAVVSGLLLLLVGFRW